MGCFGDEPFDSVHRAGNSPRQASNFSLLRQRKVTKREALNRTRAPWRYRNAGQVTLAVRPEGDPLRSRRCPCEEHQGSNLHAP